MLISGTAWLTALVILFFPGSAWASITVSGTGQVLWEVVVPSSIYFGKQDVKVYNASFQVLADEHYETLCALRSIEEWGTKGREIITKDVLYVPGYYDDTCHGGLGAFAVGTFHNYWCALNVTVLRDTQKQVHPGHWSYASYHGAEPDSECQYIFVRHKTREEIALLIENTENQLVTVETDPNVWVEYLEQTWVQNWFRLVLPIWTFVLLIYALYGTILRRNQMVIMHQIILTADCSNWVVVLCFGFVYGPGCFLGEGSSMSATLLMFTQLFAMSVGSDVALAVFYADATHRQYSRSSKVGSRDTIYRFKVVLLFGCVGLPLTEGTIQLLSAFVFSSDQVVNISTFWWPLFVSAVQLVVMIYLWRRTTQMAQMVLESKDSSTPKSRVHDAMAKLELRLRKASRMVIWSSTVSLACFALFSQDFFYASPWQYVVINLLYRVAKLVNSYARIQAVFGPVRKKGSVHHLEISN